MTIVKSKTLLVLALLIGAGTAYNLFGMVNSGMGESLALFSLGLVNAALGAVAAFTIFVGRRSAKKWFLWSCAGSLATVPMAWLTLPQAPFGAVVTMFVLMAIVCSIFWGMLNWKSAALDQPPSGGSNA